MNSVWELEFERQMQAVMDGRASSADLHRLDDLLAENPAAMDAYIALIKVDALLRWRSGPGQKECHRGRAAMPAAAHAIQPPSRPRLPLLGSTIQGMVGYMSSGWPVAYLIATVIFGTGLLVGSVVHVSEPAQVARHSVSLPSPLSPLPSIVGRITGMVDCKWETKGLGIRDWGLEESSKSKVQGSEEVQSLISNPQSLVSLGDKFVLVSGLMEITYDTGAKVILQGPVTYEVESAASGYLSVGKLTARLEKKVASGQWPVASKSEIRNLKSEVSNSQSPIPNPLLATNHYPLFTIKTPTAFVTDLGTEFGVTVLKDGLTQVHVLRGAVDARIVDPRSSTQRHQRVTEGLAVEMGRKSMRIDAVAFAPRSFVRRLGAPVDTPAEAAYINAVLADKPLGYWPLNEPKSSLWCADRSGQGLRARIMSECTAGRPGPMPGGSKAVEFYGNGCVDIGFQERFAFTGPFTVEAWIWIDRPTTDYATIISADAGDAGANTAGWGLYYLANPRRRTERLQRPCLVFSLCSVRDFLFDAVEAPTRQWLHVAVAFDAGKAAHLYLNGEHRASLSEKSLLKVQPVWVGIGRTAGGGFPWNGRLAHVAVYPRALSAQQIQNHFNQRPGVQQ